MTRDFFNNYIFIQTFQWTSSECYNNVTVTVKVVMATTIVGYFIKGGLSRGASENNRSACFEIICGISGFLKEPFFRKLSDFFYVGS